MKSFNVAVIGSLIVALIGVELFVVSWLSGNSFMSSLQWCWITFFGLLSWEIIDDLETYTRTHSLRALL